MFFFNLTIRATLCAYRFFSCRVSHTICDVGVVGIFVSTSQGLSVELVRKYDNHNVHLSQNTCIGHNNDNSLSCQQLSHRSCFWFRRPSDWTSSKIFGTRVLHDRNFTEKTFFWCFLHNTKRLHLSVRCSYNYIPFIQVSVLFKFLIYTCIHVPTKKKKKKKGSGI